MADTAQTMPLRGDTDVQHGHQTTIPSEPGQQQQHNQPSKPSSKEDSILLTITEVSPGSNSTTTLASNADTSKLEPKTQTSSAEPNLFPNLPSVRTKQQQQRRKRSRILIGVVAAISAVAGVAATVARSDKFKALDTTRQGAGLVPDDSSMSLSVYVPKTTVSWPSNIESFWTRSTGTAVVTTSMGS